MKKRIVRFLVIVAVTTVFNLPAEKARANEPYITYYEVHYILGVPPYDDVLVGYWVRDCDGNLTGWGWAPYDEYANYTIETLGDTCYQTP